MYIQPYRVYMLRPNCKPGRLKADRRLYSWPARFKAGRPAIKPAGPIINRCKRLAGFKAGRTDLQPGPAYICANEQMSKRPRGYGGATQARAKRRGAG